MSLLSRVPTCMRKIAYLLPLLILAPSQAAEESKQSPSKKAAKAEKAKPKARVAPKRDKSPRSVLNRLTDMRVTVTLKKAPLTAFVDYLRKATGINFVIRKHVINKESDLDSMEVTIDIKDVRVVDALILVLDQFELTAKIRKNVVLITTKKDARGKPVLVIYEVADIVTPIRDFPGSDINLHPSGYEPPDEPEPEMHATVDTTDELAEMIRQFCAADTWEDEGVRIFIYNKRMIIRQYPAVHHKITRFLALVRAH